MPTPSRLLDMLFSVARQADAALTAPSVENARRAMKANEHRAAAQAALDLDLERFLFPVVEERLQMGGAK